MRAMILAAGRGSRLSPLTDTLPKPLVRLAGKPLIEYQIEAIKRAGIHEIVINTGWLGQQLIDYLGNGKRYGVQIEYSVEPQAGLETGGGIFQALPLLGDKPFLLANADIYHQIDLSEFLTWYKMTSEDSLVNLLLVKNPEQHPLGDFCVRDKFLVEKEGVSEESAANSLNLSTYTYSGMGVYAPGLFSASRQGKYSVVPLIKKAIRSSEAYGFYSDSAWFDAGTQERLSSIEKFILDSQ